MVLLFVLCTHLLWCVVFLLFVSFRLHFARLQLRTCVITVYDVTRRSSFTSLEHWLNEVNMYSSNADVITLLVGNKIDMVRVCMEFALPSVVFCCCCC